MLRSCARRLPIGVQPAAEEIANPGRPGGSGDTLQKKTLGALLGQFRKHVTISDDAVSALLSDALQKRNFLIHRFFLDRQEKFRTEQGRLEMLSELVAIGDQLEKATDVTNGMRIALCRALATFRRKNDVAAGLSRHRRFAAVETMEDGGIKPPLHLRFFHFCAGK